MIFLTERSLWFFGGIVSEQYDNLAYGLNQLALRFLANLQRDDLALFAFRTDFDFNQFVSIESDIDFIDYGRRQTGLTNHNNRIQRMGLRLQGFLFDRVHSISNAQ